MWPGMNECWGAIMPPTRAFLAKWENRNRRVFSIHFSRFFNQLSEFKPKTIPIFCCEGLTVTIAPCCCSSKAISTLDVVKRLE
jgi:hypothetical protein